MGSASTIKRRLNPLGHVAGAALSGIVIYVYFFFQLELLPDVKVNEILLECGETGGIPDKSKPNIYKKNKKMKKQKKAAKKIKEKDKTVEDSPLISYDMKETEIFEQMLSLSGMFDSDEFALDLRPYLTTLYLTNF